MADASLNAMHQDRHEADRYRRIELITGTVRRRRWTIDEKAAIVAESTRPGVNVAEVARRFGVNRGLLQTWRRKAIGEASVFVPLRVEGLVATDSNKDRSNSARAWRWRPTHRPSRERSRSKAVACVYASPDRSMPRHSV